MSLWKRGIERGKDVKKSEELAKKRDECVRKFPAIMEAWEKEDATVVRRAAEELTVVLQMENPAEILEARKTLQQALWKRDTPKEKLQREIDRLGGEIEVLNSPLILEKATEWGRDVILSKEKKIIEKVGERATLDSGRQITFKSNFGTIAMAKERLIEAISRLRGMRQAPLSEIQEFIKKIEAEFLGIDFSVLTESKEVSERKFEEYCSQPEVTIYTTARLVPGSRPGQDKIEKDYNLPVKEFK